MNDAEIYKKRNELSALRASIMQEWQEYDEQYPVIPGAFKPLDYDDKQREFHRRQSEISEEIRNLPSTKTEKIKKGIIVIGVVACAGVLAWYFIF